MIQIMESDNKRTAEEAQLDEKDEQPKPLKVRRCVKKLNCATEHEVGIESFVDIVFCDLEICVKRERNSRSFEE